jgi:hypothetical protein
VGWDGIDEKQNTKDRSGDRKVVGTTIQLNCLSNLTQIKPIIDYRVGDRAQK